MLVTLRSVDLEKSICETEECFMSHAMSTHANEARLSYLIGERGVGIVWQWTQKNGMGSYSKCGYHLRMLGEC